MLYVVLCLIAVYGLHLLGHERVEIGKAQEDFGKNQDDERREEENIADPEGHRLRTSRQGTRVRSWLRQ